MKKLFVCYFILQHAILYAQVSWKIEINGGLPINFPSPLIIKQSGYPVISTWAKYYSEPFKLPVYWDIKLNRLENKVGYEIELMHHKLYLKNKPNDVQHFGISHGFNLLFVNRIIECSFYTLRLGAGAIIAHPESEIRGQTFGDAVDPYDMGYFITGPTVQIAFSKYFGVLQRLRLNTEAKLLVAYSHTPIARGKAHVWYAGVHLLAGIQGLIFDNE
ncbi:MAG: hypothetical protein N2662_05940 [Bacteroidales bacterium]|nr:hypothetical protein [Bacteroidales bacterium]